MLKDVMFLLGLTLITLVANILIQILLIPIRIDKLFGLNGAEENVSIANSYIEEMNGDLFEVINDTFRIK